MSHPSRGAWIEMPIFVVSVSNIASHPSRGAWIEIALWQLSPYARRRRTPHGVRGLK